MDASNIVSVAVLSVVLCLAVLVMLVVRRRGREGERRPQQLNYRVFFFIGAAMLAVGTAELVLFLRSDVSFVVALPLMMIGLVFMLIGLANRGRWSG
jgi:amino acid transporter